MRSTAIFVIILLEVFCSTASAQVEKEKNHRSFILYSENDTLNQTDRHYTNGIKLTWISQDMTDFRECTFLPAFTYPLVDRLPFVNNPGTQRDMSFSIGQNIYTPSDITRSDLIEDDRPYAGITYFGMGFHSKTVRQMDTLEFYTGLVGPHSYAEDVQKAWHEWIGSDIPQGWHHQLKDEPVLGVTYEGKRKLFRSKIGKEFGYDFNMHYGGGLGNAYTYANAGADVRFGFNLPMDFGTCRILPVSCTIAAYDEKLGFFRRRRLGIYFFLAVDGQAVLRDIYLDGNTFKDSHSVQKEPFVADLMMGTAFIAGRFRLSFANVYRTKMFKTQKEDQGYVSVSMSVSY